MYYQKAGLRADYRRQENQREKESQSLAERFPDLKCLTVNLGFFDGGTAGKTSEIKYSVNVAHARSVFRFNCSNTECVWGDFDLSEQLARAVAERLQTVTGELRCKGWRSKATIDRVPCDNLLRFELTMGY